MEKTKEVVKKSTKKKEMTIDFFIDQELKKFDFSDKKFKSIQKKYSSLEIEGVNDKEGYEAVRLAIADVRTTKTSIEKKRKEIKESSLKFGRAVDAEARRLSEFVIPIYNELQEKKAEIDKEKEKIKEQKRLEKEKVVTDRSVKLMEIGMSFDGVKYHYNDHIVTVAQLSVLNDKNFNGIVDDVMDVIAKDKEREEAQKKLDEKIESRVQAIIQAGLREFITPEEDANMNYGAATEDEYTDFYEMLLSRKEEAEKKEAERKEKARKEREEQERKEKELKAREEKLRKEEEALAKKKAQEEEKRRKDEMEAKKKKELAEAKKRKKALQPDLKKIGEYMKALQAVPVPKMKEKEAQEILNDVTSKINEFVKNIESSFLK